MGSGINGAYSRTNGASQSYAASYHVEPAMKKYDKERETYHNGRYDKNPTAHELQTLINGNYIKGKTYSNENLPYVITTKGDIIVGRRNGNGRNGQPTPHPTLIGGRDPVVKMAGILKIRGGKIYSYDNNSGHYKPNKKSMSAAKEAFDKLPRKLFAKNSPQKPGGNENDS